MPGGSGHADARGDDVRPLFHGHHLVPGVVAPSGEVQEHHRVVGEDLELLAQAPTDAEIELVVELDRARSDSVRRIWPFLRDRRIDAYGGLTRRLID